MTIPKSYEALAADLASEKIISKTLLGQKEAYMMLADKGRLDLSESKAREAALREELERANSRYDREVLGLNNEGDPIGGDPAGGYRNDNARLQQRLTVAEQRVGNMQRLLEKYYNRSDACAFMAKDIGYALKPAAEPTIEVARQSLSFENQRIQPARFHCLACGEYHEGSGNLPCPKMKPISGVKP